MTIAFKLVAGLGLATVGSIIPGKVGRIAFLSGAGFVASGLFDLSTSGLFSSLNFVRDPAQFLGLKDKEVSITSEALRKSPGSVQPTIPRASNLLGIAGRITSPRQGSNVDIGLAGTFPVRALIENQSNSTQLGRIQVHITEQRDRLLTGGRSTLIVNGPTITLGSGELRQVNIEAPTNRSSVGGIEATIGLFFDGHLLERVSITRSLV